MLALVWGLAVYTWKVEAAPFQEFAFAQPMALHNRGTKSFPETQPELQEPPAQALYSLPSIHSTELS